MQQPAQAQLAQHVVIVVEGEPVEAEPEPQVAGHEIRDRRLPGAEAQVGAGVDRDGHAPLGQQFAFAAPQPHAVRQREPWRQEADTVEPGEVFPLVFAVGPFALVAGLQAVHVQAPAGAGGFLGRRLEQPARHESVAVGPELDLDRGILARVCRRMDERHLVLQRRRCERPLPSDRLAVRAAGLFEEALVAAVGEPAAVAQRHDEGEADADVARRPAGRLDLFEAVEGLRHVAVHRRGDAGARHAREGDGVDHVGIDRGVGGGKLRQPDLERRIDGAVGEPAQAAAMVVGVGEAGDDQTPRTARVGLAERVLDRRDLATVDAERRAAPCRLAPRRRQQAVRGDRLDRPWAGAMVPSGHRALTPRLRHCPIGAAPEQRARQRRGNPT